jgi:hypothetical protein
MNHFLDIHTTDPAALRSMIDQARAMKSARNGRGRAAPDDTQPLDGKMVALIFEKPSTRTRVSFDVGVRQMGGQTMVLSGAELQLGHGETIADTARVLSRYVDLIMIRTYEDSVLQELAEYAEVPVINGLTNRTHPCQIMADVLTYEEHRGPIAGARSSGRATATMSAPRSCTRPGSSASISPSPARRPSTPSPSSSLRPRPGQQGRDRARPGRGRRRRRPDRHRYLGVDARQPVHEGTPPQPAAPLPGQRAPDGGGETRRALHALPARASRGRGDERGDGRARSRSSGTRPRTASTPRRRSCAGASASEIRPHPLLPPDPADEAGKSGRANLHAFASH